eukprot:5674340-Amphidinium_carterae.2
MQAEPCTSHHTAHTSYISFQSAQHSGASGIFLMTGRATLMKGVVDLETEETTRLDWYSLTHLVPVNTPPT